MTAAGGPFGFIDLPGRGGARSRTPRPRAITAGRRADRGGWRRPSDFAALNASDSTGIRRRGSTSTAASSPPKSALRLHPPGAVPKRRRRPLLRYGIADGAHTVRLVARGCGRQRRVRAALGVDGWDAADRHPQARAGQEDRSLGEGPGLGCRVHERRGPQPLHRSLSDAEVDVRERQAARDARHGRRVAGSTSASPWRDNAGNVPQGNPTRLSATSAKVGRRLHRVRRGRVRSRSAGRRSCAVACRSPPVDRWPARRSSRPRQSGGRRSSRRGRERDHRPARPLLDQRPGGPEPRLPSGLQRRPRRARAPRADSRSACRLRARSRRHALVSPAGRVRFSGRLRGAACLCRPRPRRSCSRAARAASGARSRTRAHTARAAGTCHYGFSGRPGSYPIRLRIRRQAGFPFELGYSRRLTIRVG